ncbi:hypothetical protein BH11MYX3_BH11MYX3_17110 [soil metagenome]
MRQHRYVDVVLYRRAGLLRYAAIQFVVLVGAAMAVYAGGSYWHADETGYGLTRNFLSDLGMTRAWSGHANHASAVLFGIALASVGVTLIVFSWTWRRFASMHGRARLAGRMSVAFGTASGISFTGIACTPFDVALHWHNSFVFAAFSLLLGYVVTLAIVMTKNGATRVQNAVNIGYIVLVLGYVALIFFGPRLGTEHGHRIQVIGQKLIALGSMAHVIVLTTLLRRAERQTSHV